MLILTTDLMFRLAGAGVGAGVTAGIILMVVGAMHHTMDILTMVVTGVAIGAMVVAIGPVITTVTGMAIMEEVIGVDVATILVMLIVITMETEVIVPTLMEIIEVITPELPV